MKKLFAGVFAVLCVATIGTVLTKPSAVEEVPMLYWVTDSNPARTLQLERFHAWLEKDPTRPKMIMKVDYANRDVSKQIIQGVSGVGGDVMDIWSPSGNVHYFNEIGILEDVTEWGRFLGFSPDKTYAAIRPELVIGDRQFMFPCNVTVPMYWVNKDTFAKHGMETPPRRWTLDEFEAVGREFVRRANEGLPYHKYFLADYVDPRVIAWSLGLDRFNETLTRCTLDDPRYVETLSLVRKWTYEDRILPSAADTASFSSEAGYLGLTLQLFDSGNFAMIWRGRYALIQLREFGAMNFSVSEPPHGGFPNSSTGSRAAGIYAGSKNKDLAKYFLAFLASEDYNTTIVEDADALPPNPEFTKTEAYRRPKAHPNEWGCHEVFSDAAATIAVPVSHSPFVSTKDVNRSRRSGTEGFMTKPRLYSAEEEAARAARRINGKIQQSLRERPKLRTLYEKLVARQKEIDARRAAGQKVPLDWLENPFHRKYYRAQGWVE